MRVTFENVTVTVEAQNDVQAYRLLGERLGVPTVQISDRHILG